MDKVNEKMCCEAIYEDVTALFTKHADAKGLVNVKEAVIDGVLNVGQKKCCCGRPAGKKGTDLCVLAWAVPPESISWIGNDNGCKQLVGRGYHNYIGTSAKKCNIPQLQAEELHENIISQDKQEL
jgi:hypothetical protein